MLIIKSSERENGKCVCKYKRVSFITLLNQVERNIDMTRDEFGKLILQCRKDSGMKMIDICVELQTLPQSIYRVESGKCNTNMSFILQLLKVLKFNLLIDGRIFKTEKALAKWMKKGRGERTLSEVANFVGINYQMISKIENGQATMMLDTLLKISDLYNSKISIKQINE